MARVKVVAGTVAVALALGMEVAARGMEVASGMEVAARGMEVAARARAAVARVGRQS